MIEIYELIFLKKEVDLLTGKITKEQFIND